LGPDIVILNIGMPNLNGLEAARQILHYNPQSKVLILTINDADEIVRPVLNRSPSPAPYFSDQVNPAQAAPANGSTEFQVDEVCQDSIAFLVIT
jgi:DNA-binding NarL/FixJ family response regulator